ncbi:MAG TPA: hypothetical protein VG347_13330 [Verrucomicrobiae bacterium]|nr:hypothetical protein [Verrucomicrobiae bacterium]
MATSQNQTLVTLYKSLCAQQDALSSAIQKATDANVADAISTENYEVMHRIVLVQNLLFQADSPELQASVKAVKDASGQLESAIANIQRVTDFINGVSSYLELVDKAIDLAKTLAPLAA